jgi:hypothetical protein
MSYSQTWLEDPSAIRMLLVDATAYNVVTSQEVKFYFSTTGYMTSDRTSFLPVIVGSMGFTESISADDSTSISFGDIELHNLNGELDDLLDSTKYIWSNRPIKVYYGDPGWSYTLAQIPTTFLTVFDGTIDDIDTRTTRTINFRVRDKLERLNAPITENKIGTYGTWEAGQQNKDATRPLVFGEVFNISPVLIDPSTLEYCFSSSNPDSTTGFANNGESEKLLEIRDNGVPIFIPGNANYDGATVNLANSTFKLTKSSAGAITCSVQGVKKSIQLSGSTGTLSNTYTNNIPNTIAVIATQFGKANSRLLTSEIDYPTFSTFNSTAEIGLLVSGTENVLTVCQELASSIGGQLIMSRTGQLRLIQFGTPISGVASVNITVDDILFDSLSVSDRPGVKAAIKLGYARNYTVQENLLSAIPNEHKALFEEEWFTTTSKNGPVGVTYKLDTDPEQKDTALISTADAEAEATRLMGYFDEQRVVYKFTGKSRLLSLVLGQSVVLYHHRFGLSSGKAGQVISLSPNWLKEQVEVEVIV